MCAIYSESKLPYGYKSNGEIDPLQAEIIKKYFEYMINPPQFLVDEVIQEYKDNYNKELSHDEAIAKIDNLTIWDVVGDEFHEKYEEYLEEQKVVDIYKNKRFNMIQGTLAKKGTNTIVSAPVVDREIFEKVQAILQQKD